MCLNLYGHSAVIDVFYGNEQRLENAFLNRNIDKISAVITTFPK